MPTLEQARTWYTDADPVHDFSHVERVYRMAEKISAAEGADVEIVRAAALLHDVEGSAPEGAGRASHHHESAEFAAEVLQAEGWPAERIAAVQHCIRAHRFRDRSEPPATLEAQVLFDADKLDVLGAIGQPAPSPTPSWPANRFTPRPQRNSARPARRYPANRIALITNTCSS